jgi:hypothetical protein
MKKIYAFLAAALMSASLFAAPEKIPTVADLSAVADVANDVVLCLYFDEAPCNDVVLVGTYKQEEGGAWSTEGLDKFAKLDNFDGWYVASFPYAEGAAGKAVQLKGDGSFDWKYQTGDKDAWIHQGGNEATIEAGYDGESNVSYPSAGAYIYEIAYWKLHNTPCVNIPKHKYTLVLKDPYCEENPEFVPAVAGDHNGWAISPMNEGTYEGDFAWILVVETEEGNAYKFLEATKGWDNELKGYDAEADKWNKFGNSTFPVATKDTTLVFDYSDTEKFQYPLCGVSDEKASVVVSLIAPANAPEKVEIIGTFDSWAGTEMTLENGQWVALVEATEGDVFKFRSGIGETSDDKWANQIQVPDGEGGWRDMGDEMTFGAFWQDGEEEGAKVVTLDFSYAAAYKWTLSEAQGIENIVLTEEVQKVVVDGVIYIVRDNKMFNIHGAQVR